MHILRYNFLPGTIDKLTIINISKISNERNGLAMSIRIV